MVAAGVGMAFARSSVLRAIGLCCALSALTLPARAADQGVEAVVERLGELTDTVRVALFATGCASIADAQTRPILAPVP